MEKTTTKTAAKKTPSRKPRPAAKKPATPPGPSFTESAASALEGLAALAEALAEDLLDARPALVAELLAADALLLADATRKESGGGAELAAIIAIRSTLNRLAEEEARGRQSELVYALFMTGLFLVDRVQDAAEAAA